MPRLFFVLLIIFPVATLADLEISDAWIKNLPPVVPVRAGYMNIFNPGSEAVSILSLSSDAFTDLEIHQTIMQQDGLMRMEQIHRLTIEPNSQLNLEPGGIHLMMRPIEPTNPGDKIRITFELSDGSQQSLIFTVKR